MKNLFTKTTCPKCGQRYDPALGECPSCHEKNAIPDRGKGWNEVTVTSVGEQIALFLCGSLGLSIVALIIELLLQSIAKSAYEAEGLSGSALHNALTAYTGTAAYLAYVNLSVYMVLFIILLFVLGKSLYSLTAKFRQGRTYWGFLIGIGMMMVTSLLSVALSTESGGNQSAVNSVESYAPFASLIIIGLVGPFCEEVTYRVGLYTFLKRIHWSLALVITSLVFTFIHFDFTQIGSLNEWKNALIYLSMAIILNVTYEKLGFGASFLAHATNNFVGVLLTIIVSSI